MEPEKADGWKRRIPLLLAGCIAASALMFTVFRDMGVVETWRLGKTRRLVLEENARLRDENARLRQEVQRLKTSPAYIEEIARRELGLIKNRENVIVLDRAHASPSPPAVPPSGR